MWFWYYSQGPPAVSVYAIESIGTLLTTIWYWVSSMAGCNISRPIVVLEGPSWIVHRWRGKTRNLRIAKRRFLLTCCWSQQMINQFICSYMSKIGTQYRLVQINRRQTHVRRLLVVEKNLIFRIRAVKTLTVWTDSYECHSLRWMRL